MVTLHKRGESMPDSRPPEDNPWELDTSRRTIVLNEIKRRGALGMDKGNLNTPVGRVWQSLENYSSGYDHFDSILVFDSLDLKF